jgi:hypothetical protein
MIIPGKRRTGTPILKGADGSIIRPKRISFTQKTLDEGWISEYPAGAILAVDIDEDNIFPPEEKFFVTLGESVKPELVNFARSIIDDLEGLGCIVEWHSASYVIKFPDPGGSRINFSLISVYNWGAIFVGSLTDQLNRAGLPKQIGLDYTKITASLFNYEVSEKDPGFWSWKN